MRDTDRPGDSDSGQHLTEVTETPSTTLTGTPVSQLTEIDLTHLTDDPGQLTGLTRSTDRRGSGQLTRTGRSTDPASPGQLTGPPDHELTDGGDHR